MRMRIRGFLLTALALVPAVFSRAADSPKPPTFALLLSWAGPDAVALGFKEDQIAAFLQARKADLRAGHQGPWSDWLKALEKAKSPSLRAWALARRVEAGDFTAYGSFEGAISEHLLGISKPGSGRGDQIITDPPRVKALELPDALRIDHQSPFWQALRKTVQSTPDRKLDAGLYAIWCYGTHPDQKDLILELAAHVESRLTVLNPNPDPWNDPRFWIIVDWAIAWGSRTECEAIIQALSNGPAQVTFERTIHRVESIQDTFRESATGDPATRRPTPAMAPGDALPQPSLDPAPGPLADLHFSQIKVLEQPPAPRYPVEAKARKMMTNLILTLVVDPQGKPISCRPVPGPWLGFFAPVGMAYGMRWTFNPALLNGVPQYARFRLTMPFRLRN